MLLLFDLRLLKPLLERVDLFFLFFFFHWCHRVLTYGLGQLCLHLRMLLLKRGSSAFPSLLTVVWLLLGGPCVLCAPVPRGQHEVTAHPVAAHRRAGTVRVLDADVGPVPLRADPEPLAGRRAEEDVGDGPPVAVGVVRPGYPGLVPQVVPGPAVVGQGKETAPREGGVPPMRL